MKLIGVTQVYNEEPNIPYVMPYVERMGYDKFIVYDDSSTDRTVEMLSRYPFIEIRQALPPEKCKVNAFENSKLKAMTTTFSECSDIIRENSGETVWMTITDFDEVIYSQRERSFLVRSYLEYMSERGFNYYDGRMLHLTWDGKARNGDLPHTWPGVRGSWWMQEGCKCTMLKVNDVLKVCMYCGNHAMGVTPIDGVKMVNLADTGDFNGFHFKYFDGSLKHRGMSLVDDPTEAIKTVRDCSFPLEEYFLMKGFFAKRTEENKRDLGEGLHIVD